MTAKEIHEISLCFSTYLAHTRKSANHDSAEVANLATDMVKHLINKFPEIKKEMFWNGDGELLEDLGIQRST